MYIFIHKKTPSGVIRPNGVPHPPGAVRSELRGQAVPDPSMMAFDLELDAALNPARLGQVRLGGSRSLRYVPTICETS